MEPGTEVKFIDKLDAESSQARYKFGTVCGKANPNAKEGESEYNNYVIRVQESFEYVTRNAKEIIRINQPNRDVLQPNVERMTVEDCIEERMKQKVGMGSVYDGFFVQDYTTISPLLPDNKDTSDSYFLYYHEQNQENEKEYQVFMDDRFKDRNNNQNGGKTHKFTKPQGLKLQNIHTDIQHAVTSTKEKSLSHYNAPENVKKAVIELYDALTYKNGEKVTTYGIYSEQ